MTTLRARVLDAVSANEVRWIEDARVTWDRVSGRLTAVEPWTSGPCDVDLRDRGVLTAGCVDGHVHAAQARVIGRASGPLLRWLERTVFPEEQRWAQPEFAEAVATRFWRDVLAAGTTTALAYGSVHASASEAILRAADRAGIRAMVGPVWMDEACPEALQVPAAQQAEAVASLAARWQDHPRLEVIVIPRFAVSCSPEMLRTAAHTARTLGLRISTHLAETPDEGAFACERHGGASYLDIYDRAGLLVPGTVLAHCIHLDEADWRALAAVGAVVAHCPDSNDFLGSGGMPVGALLEHGVGMVLGTDVAAGRSLRVPRTASHAYDNSLRVGAPQPPEAWWWWATAGGARALGLSDRGRVEVGQWADLVLHEVPETVVDGDSALAALIFDPDGSRVRRVWVGGREVDLAGA